MSAGLLVVVLGPGSPSPARIARAAAGRVGFVGVGGTVETSSADLARSLATYGELDVDPDTGAIDHAALAAWEPVGITTFSDAVVSETAQLAAALGLDHHSTATAEALTRKSVQRARLAEAEVDTTRSVTVTDRAGLIEALGGSPAVVKPVRGRGSLDTHLVHSPGDVPPDLPVTADNPFVVEEYLLGRDEHPFGDYVSVETITIAGVTRVLGVTGKFALLPPFREAGQFVPALLPTSEQEQIADLTVRALSALGVTRGLAHTEIKLTRNGPRIIEVNGRLGGQVDELYERAHGLDLIGLELAVARGDRPDSPLRPLRRVFYQYANLNPGSGGTLVAATGAATVRARPGVASYRPLVARGRELPSGVSTVELDLLCGAVDTHSELLDEIGEALADLRFTIVSEGHTREWQSDLGGLRCLS